MIGIAVIRQERELPDVAHFARAAVFGNPLIDQIRARGGVDPERVVDALEQEFRREFGGNPGRMPIQAIVFSAARTMRTGPTRSIKEMASAGGGSPGPHPHDYAQF